MYLTSLKYIWEMKCNSGQNHLLCFLGGYGRFVAGYDDTSYYNFNSSTYYLGPTLTFKNYT